MLMSNAFSPDFRNLLENASRDSKNESSNHEVEIFTGALQLPPGRRHAYLKNACGENVALRQTVEKLLAVHGAIGDFLEDSPGCIHN